MAEFYPDGETSHRSEKLAINRTESLFAFKGRQVCGCCRLTIHHAETKTQCPALDCKTVWKQVIYVEPTISFRHESLPMISEAVLPRFDSLPGHLKNKRSLFPNLGRRAVENINLTDDIL